MTILSNNNFTALQKVMWGMVVLTLPVTSFRYIPTFFGASSIRPLAIYPLAILMLLFGIQIIKTRRVELPKISSPLAAFFLVAAIATLIGFLYDPLVLRGQTSAGRAVRAWFSIAIGMAFFISAYWMNKNADDVKHTLKWMYVGLGASVIWGGIQIVVNELSFLDINLIENIQLLFSQRGLPDNGRIVGFAFEPAWFADQIVILYYPWLFAAILTDYRIFKYRWVEPILFLLGGVMLVFTFSRGGILIGLIAVLATALITSRKQLGVLWIWLLSPLNKTDNKQLALRPGVIRVTFITAVLLVVFSAGTVLSQNKYFSSILEFDSATDVYSYVIDASAGSRLAFAISGLNVYADYPWTGVGLGASALYLYDYLPDWALSELPEINRKLSPDSKVVSNVKNLYVRLLAETGIIGFWFFVAFFLGVLAEIRQLYISNKAIARYVAIAGLFIWIAVALRNFTQDSLTFPIMWTGIGIVLGISSGQKS